VVLFETPHRIREALRDVQQILGERLLVLGRELTKRHETILRGSASSLLERLNDPVRGEITLVLAGATGREHGAGDEDTSRIVSVWREALQASDGNSRLALRSAAKRLGLKRPELYRLLAELGEPLEPA
jgi:16S rRNA (cytidine1402-2'-O)-methyltransferase